MSSSAIIRTTGIEIKRPLDGSFWEFSGRTGPIAEASVTRDSVPKVLC